jgi:hypothetical protein
VPDGKSGINDLQLPLFFIIMKKLLFISILVISFSMIHLTADAQCSICNKTVMQMGSGPAQGFNTGILYLMFIPFAAIGVVGFKWWKSVKDTEKFEE